MDNELIKSCEAKAEAWLSSSVYDAATQAEVRKMLDNPDKTDLVESFYQNLEFGTGGLRGIMGVGTNRMNIYTVGAATQGLSNYLNKNFKDLKQIAVVVGHDCRNNSRLFAEVSANIFAANGIKVYLFDDMRPTPEMSFAIRQLDMKIVYTPIHGTGMMLIPRSLQLWGFENVNTVPEQMVKDGNFPTVVSPNPENAEALSMAIALAKKIDADIVMASDPDADRVGMACKDSNGEWVLVNGNQTCMIFLYYIIKNRIAMGKMKGNEFVVKTIVTTELIKAIADKNG